jgi:hypothetical protein
MEESLMPRPARSIPPDLSHLVPRRIRMIAPGTPAYDAMVAHLAIVARRVLAKHGLSALTDELLAARDAVWSAPFPTRGATRGEEG